MSAILPESASPAAVATPAAPEPIRDDYRLRDALLAQRGRVMLSGTQALVRLLLMQRAADAEQGLDTRGFVSGYRGSPLGMVDQELWKASAELDAAGVRFVPAVNEELAATQVLGTQRVESDPERSAAAVFSMWYGKGPGVDRAGDALKHGNAYGASPHGGVLVVAGDDHGCVSSSFPHQSDLTLQAMGMPVVSPSSVAEYLEFGLYGWALSRYSGAWVGMTALSEVVESRASVDLDLLRARRVAWLDAAGVAAATGHQAPPDGLHYRWPDLPSLRIETRLADKLDAVRAFARVNSIDRELISSRHARVGIVTCGKAHHDLMEALRRLEITPAMLADAGVRLYKVGLSFPLEPTRALEFARGLDELLVIEEKAPVVETQLRSMLYNQPPGQRPAVVGKHDRDGRPLVSATGELRPSRLIEIVADWLVRHFPDQRTFNDHRRHVRDFLPAQLPPSPVDALRRIPYFCAGCPHNTSTRVPEGSTARAGIGCHFMASWMERDTGGLIQMGGEGVDWVSHSMFTRVPHVFQNLGDGTYYHSGYLAIRQAVAAGARLTYKILFNDAVAMTGGQPVDGKITVDAIARQVESEGVRRVAVVSENVQAWRSLGRRFPPGTSFHHRDELDAVQRELRELDGVTVLIYEQTCAAELRRRRKKGLAPERTQRLFIHEKVCEGCGDCSVQSNCVAVQPLETELGRKRRIDQTACNKDYSCAKGFCPSFVSIEGAVPKRRLGLQARAAERLLERAAALPQPAPHDWNAPYDLLVTGVGGTGVVTVGALVAMAAHLQNHHASVLDFMGFAQKGGAVLSFVRLADRADRLHQVRIDAQQADAVLACDLVTAASAEALQTVRHARTRVLVNEHASPTAHTVLDGDTPWPAGALLAKLRGAAGDDFVRTLDAQAWAEEFLGDTTTANVLALGHAWQLGMVPVSAAALERAIELNGVAVKANRIAFALGRLAAADPQACRELLSAPGEQHASPATARDFMDVAMRQLRDWQDDAWARRFARCIDRVRERETELGGDGRLADAAARSLLRLMSYKDEYEVARLYTDGSLARALAEQFDGEPRIHLNLAPPWLARSRGGGAPRKLRVGAWVLPGLRLLARARRLRGTWFDPFGHSAERRTERALIAQFETLLDDVLPQLRADNLEL
ncbi:MAG: indolepyruvate ferredoxin oxidoreductase family protein, partial [Betaproteobacteria bacterium]|nr:indolepyruvate ferredoxin oxidoreductase family protein [Betaproteobacteria bacterium]